MLATTINGVQNVQIVTLLQAESKTEVLTLNTGYGQPTAALWSF